MKARRREPEEPRLHRYAVMLHHCFCFPCLNMRCFAKLNLNGEIMPEPAKNGDTVRVHYTGRLESGEVFDSSEDGEPLEFQLGSGQVIAGFDENVTGMNVGDQKTITIEPANAYGDRIEALVGKVDRAQLNMEGEPQVGMELRLQLPDGQDIPIIITEVTPDSVTFDANHPLAGRTLIFDIKRV
jgi:FKBP-type peptidyl-prolyl cis-trans isomerase 2